MRRPAARSALTVAALGSPTVLAFFSGGYFDAPRLWATIVAWALVIVAAVAAMRPLPRSRAGIAALTGLVALTGWTAASFAWAPAAAVVQTDLTRILLYAGVLIAARALLGHRATRRLTEPALAGGTVVVVGYGLAERVLPGLLTFARSFTAGGRLEQPLTYWNAEGALAAMGLVLCARVAGDRTRSRPLRAAAAAANVILGAGLYLSFSRGAIVAALAGLVALVGMRPTFSQIRAALLAAAVAVAAAVTVGVLPGVASLHGSLATREREGAIALALLVVLCAVGAAFTAWAVRAERSGHLRSASLPRPVRLRVASACAVPLLAVGLVLGAVGEHQDPHTYGANAARLTSIGSLRANYWAVAVQAFAHHPLDGLGSGGFRVAWLRERTVPVAALDAHSLELQTAAELGVVGLAALAMLIGGVAFGARRGLRRDPELVAGWCAALVVWLLHSAIDWDWQMPALTLLAVILGGAVLSAAEDVS